MTQTNEQLNRVSAADCLEALLRHREAGVIPSMRIFRQCYQTLHRLEKDRERSTRNREAA